MLNNFRSSVLRAAAVSLLLFGCGVRIVAAEEAEPYRIQPGDVLTIAVWKEPELVAEVIVRPDGGVSFPLAGDMMAAGGTVETLRGVLDERLRKYIPDPVVTVAVKTVSGNRIYVVGKVNRPGEFPLGTRVDVMQALAMAGGATPFADVDDIRILRRDGKRQSSLRFRYTEVERGKELSQNVLLQSGDTVIVP